MTKIISANRQPHGALLETPQLAQRRWPGRIRLTSLVVLGVLWAILRMFCLSGASLCAFSGAGSCDARCTGMDDSDGAFECAHDGSGGTQDGSGCTQGWWGEKKDTLGCGVEWTLSRIGAGERWAFREVLFRRMPSAHEVKAYLEDAFGQAGVEDEAGGWVFERREQFSWAISYRRARVSETSRCVRVQWCANDDFGLSELREFFEAPFFSPDETECFYRWFRAPGSYSAVFRGHPVHMSIWVTEVGVYVQICWVR